MTIINTVKGSFTYEIQPLNRTTFKVFITDEHGNETVVYLVANSPMQLKNLVSQFIEHYQSQIEITAQAADQGTDQEADQEADQGTDQEADQGTDQEADQGTDQGTNQGTNQGKKKRLKN